jgi:GTP-sensing pleiotropic transcriptional regulator CodY
MATKLRPLTAEEKAAIEKPARSRTAAARAVEMAQIILSASRGKRVPAIAEELDPSSRSASSVGFKL